MLETLEMWFGDENYGFSEGASLLNRHAARFAHREVLDLEDNCITAQPLVASIARDVRLRDQKDPAEERYVSVSE